MIAKMSVPKTPNLLTEIFKQDALKDSETLPVYLSAVEVTGGDDFSRQFFAKLLSPLVDHSDYTLSQLVERIGQGYDNLEKTNVFSSIKPSVHVDYLHGIPKESQIRNYNNEKGIVTKVIYDLVPSAANGGNVSLGFNSQDNLVVNAGYLNNNSNHNAETVDFGVNYRPYKPSEHLVATMRFISNLRDPAFRFVADLYNSHDNNQSWQYNSSKATGGVLGVSYSNSTKTFSLFNGFALTKRSLYDIVAPQFPAAQPFEGDFLKSSFVSSLAYSNIPYSNNFKKALASDGVSALLKNEVSSDQRQDLSNQKSSFFVKSSVCLNLFKSFFNSAVTAHVFKEAGNIYASASNPQQVHLADRFYLGGIDSFKGFARNSLNNEGGLQYYKAGFTLYSKLPYFLHPIKATNEANPLRLYATSFLGDVGDNVFARRSGMACSAGVGLKYFNEWVNLNAGYFVSQRLGTSDATGVRDGFQLEVSLGGSNRFAH